MNPPYHVLLIYSYSQLKVIGRRGTSPIQTREPIGTLASSEGILRREWRLPRLQLAVPRSSLFAKLLKHPLRLYFCTLSSFSHSSLSSVLYLILKYSLLPPLPPTLLCRYFARPHTPFASSTSSPPTSAGLVSLSFFLWTPATLIFELTGTASLQSDRMI